MTRIPEVPPGLPDFKNEQEEARWYAEHPEFFEEMTRKAVEGGTFKLTRKTPAARLAQARRLHAAVNKAASTNITIRIANFEMEGEYVIISGWPVQFLPPTGKSLLRHQKIPDAAIG